MKFIVAKIKLFLEAVLLRMTELVAKTMTKKKKKDIYIIIIRVWTTWNTANYTFRSHSDIISRIPP